MFSTQIALAQRGRLIVGVSSAPAYGELAYGEIGVGAWLNDQPIRVSTIDTIENAALSTGNLKTLATGPRWPAFGRLVGRLNRIRGYGDFLHYHLLASGRIDAVVESDVNILDVGACAVIVEAAGGRFTDLDGPTAHADEQRACSRPTDACTRRSTTHSSTDDIRQGGPHMASRKIIAVVGATGAQGGGLARSILADPTGEFAVRAITRDPLVRQGPRARRRRRGSRRRGPRRRRLGATRVRGRVRRVLRDVLLEPHVAGPGARRGAHARDGGPARRGCST